MGNDYEEDSDFYSEESLKNVPDNITVEANSMEGSEESNNIENPSEEGSNGIVEDEQSLAKTYSVSMDLIGDLEVDDVEDEEEILSPEERLREFSDYIMSCCVGNKGIKKYALDRLMTIPSPHLFRDENYILFTVLHTYRGKLNQITIDEEFLKLFLNRNRGILQKSRGFIDINAYGEVEGSVELGYISGVIKHFKRLNSMEELSQQDYNTYFEKYLIEFKAIETEKAYLQAATILTDGLTIGRRKYFGYEDSSNFIRRKLAEIEGLVDIQKGAGFVSARELLLEEKEGLKSYKVSDFGKLEALNKIYGGIYTGMFYQVIAPPKAGKTKFCVRLAHTTSVVYGNNVTVWAQEGGKEAFLAQLRAVHFDHIYNTGVDISEKKFGVSQDVIMRDKFATDELRQLEMSSKLDLTSNQDYGSIEFIDKPFEVETFIDDIDTSVKHNNSKVVIIDYLQLIGSSTNKQRTERVEEAYKRLLDYCKANNIAVFTPGQYKQETMNSLLSMKDTSGADMRTAGGSSAEVIRTPDVIFAFWATTQDLINNSMKILSMPSRFSKAFPEIDVAMDLETCQFVSVS